MTGYENCHHHSCFLRHILCSTGESSDSSDVELEELCPGTLQVQGRLVRGSRGGRSRFVGRGGQLGEERPEVDTGEGTSRGPGELSSIFNPSKNKNNV